MHELSIAMSLIDVITEQLIRHSARRACSVTIEVGELSGVEPEALESAFAIATRDTELAQTKLIINRVAGGVLDVVALEVEDGTENSAGPNENPEGK